jgi:hypothetical protein
MGDNNYTEKDLDNLIRESIKDCDSLPYVCKFASTKAGFDRIFDRVKEHVFVRGIDNVDSALALVEGELSEPYSEPNY